MDAGKVSPGITMISSFFGLRHAMASARRDVGCVADLTITDVPSFSFSISCLPDARKS